MGVTVKAIVRASCPIGTERREGQPVAEGILHGHVPPPRLLLDAGPRVAVTLRGELGVEGVEIARLDPDRRARAAVAVVLGEVQDAAVPGNLRVEGKVGREAMLPVHTEAQ